MESVKGFHTLVQSQRFNHKMFLSFFFHIIQSQTKRITNLLTFIKTIVKVISILIEVIFF